MSILLTVSVLTHSCASAEIRVSICDPTGHVVSVRKLNTSIAIGGSVGMIKVIVP